MHTARLDSRRAGRQMVMIKLAKLEAAKGQKVTVVCSAEQAEDLKKEFTPEELARITFHTPLEVVL